MDTKYLSFNRDNTEKFEHTIHINNLCQLLQVFARLPDFWKITKIQNVSEYKQKIAEYEHNVRELYTVGAKTTLTNNNTGNYETRYYHVACYYIPKIVRELFEKYGVGVGIFSMQGFERRNKESKNTLKQFCNHRGNIVVPNLKRLWDIFHNNKNAY